MSVEPLQNSSNDSEVRGHVKQVLKPKFSAHLGDGASLHRHVVADLQAVSMMSEKQGCLRVCSLNMPAAW